MYGIGVDIIEIERIKATLKKYGEKFINRIFTENEIKYCESFKNSYRKYATKFAAKEAVAKALGTGIGKIQWKDIEILNSPNGAPYVKLNNSAKEYFKKINAQKIFLSISDTENLTIAFVIIK